MLPKSKFTPDMFVNFAVIATPAKPDGNNLFQGTPLSKYIALEFGIYKATPPFGGMSCVVVKLKLIVEVPPLTFGFDEIVSPEVV